jgi:phosphoribosyl-AMP cyclohydrolase
MMAWMNKQSLARTLELGQMVYWSRSRKELWHKGATSGHVQKLVSLSVDCDKDCLLARVEQTGAACHDGYESCFYRSLVDGQMRVTEPRLVDPATVYGRP